MLTIKNPTRNNAVKHRPYQVDKRVPLFEKDPGEEPIARPRAQKKEPIAPAISQQTTIPISVITGGRDITTVSPQLRAYLQKGSPSATTAMPEAYADLANVLEKIGSDIDMKSWAKLTSKQQLTMAQRAGVSENDLRILLNAAPYTVETIAKVQDVFANRYDLGLSVDDARSVASDLFEIASERNEAASRTGKYAKDAIIAPKALRWLDEKEEKILKDLTKKASETEWDTEYTGGNPDLAARAARRASYADIDESAATKQIEELIKNNIAEARKIVGLSDVDGAGFAGSSAALAWFMKNVPANKPMDYKNPIIWGKSLPGLPYPEEDQVYHAFGIDISSSDLGNLNYALVGKALGIPEWLLLQQAGAAELRDHGNRKFLESQYESLIKRDHGYGDQRDDQLMIKNGFGVYHLLD